MVAGYYGFALVVHMSVRPSVVRFCPNANDNFSKYQWIFTKIGMFTDIVKICFGIANEQISSIFDRHLPATHPHFRLRTLTRVNFHKT